MNPPDRTGPTWIKSSRSGNNACVELAATSGMIAVRHSKAPDLRLLYTYAEMAAFLEAAKNGEFDHLLPTGE